MGGWRWIEVLARQGAVGRHTYVKNLFGWQTMTACGNCGVCLSGRQVGRSKGSAVGMWESRKGCEGGYGWHVIKGAVQPGKAACLLFLFHE